MGPRVTNRRRGNLVDGRAALAVPVEVQSVLWLGDHESDAEARRKTIRSRVKEIAWDKAKVLFDERQLSFGTDLANHIIAFMNWRADLSGTVNREELLRRHWEENVKTEVKEVVRSRRHTKQADVLNKIKSESAIVLLFSSIILMICGIGRLIS